MNVTDVLGTVASLLLLWIAFLAYTTARDHLKRVDKQIQSEIANNKITAFQVAWNCIMEEPDVRKNRSELFVTRGKYAGFLENDIDDEDPLFREIWAIATAHDRYAKVANISKDIQSDLFKFQQDEFVILLERLNPFITHVQRSRPNFCKDLVDFTHQQRC